MNEYAQRLPCFQPTRRPISRVSLYSEGIDQPTPKPPVPSAAFLRWSIVTASAGTFWLLMMSVHEAGHAIGAWATGGHVTRVVLSPLSISGTDISPNPSPRTVVWCGPLIGAALPVLLFVASAFVRLPLRRWLKGFAGFCLIANGLYLASGTIAPAGDTEELLRLGASPTILCIVGVPMACAGVWLWHTLGRQWGLAHANAVELRTWALRSWFAFVLIAAVMLVISACA